jgi:hypothetical protein
MRASWLLSNSGTQVTYPRLQELIAGIAKPKMRRAYLHDLEKVVAGASQAEARFAQIGADLQGLDETAWAFVKLALLAQFRWRDPQQGWLAATDLLHEVKAYHHLARLGCSEIRFLPAGVTKSPDLQARLGTTTVLCEVKTIIATQRPTFLTKVAARLADARAQLAAIPFDGDLRRVIFLVLDVSNIPVADRVACLADVRSSARGNGQDEIVIETTERIAATDN